MGFLAPRRSRRTKSEIDDMALGKLDVAGWTAFSHDSARDLISVLAFDRCNLQGEFTNLAPYVESVSVQLTNASSPSNNII